MSINKTNTLIGILCFLFMGCSTSKKSMLSPSDPTNLEGSWELNYISGRGTKLDSLYPSKKPSINFDIKQNMASGNTGCNSFNGKLDIDGNKINFDHPMALTRMMCGDGNGEQVFLTVLKKVNKWSVSHTDTLTFKADDIAVMRFAKVKGK